MITIFDRIFHITDRSGMTACNEETLQKLDEMLTANGVKHSFEYTYPEMQDKCEEKGHRYMCSVVYCCEDDMVFDLVLSLWMTKYRNADDALIRRWWHKKAVRYRQFDRRILKDLDARLTSDA